MSRMMCWCCRAINCRSGACTPGWRNWRIIIRTVSPASWPPAPKARNRCSTCCPPLFRLPLGPHETGFAFSEARAHVNRMVIEGQLRWVDLGDGTVRVVPA
jgi:hypothetical protein